MQKVFAPAVGLMNRLTYPGKFAVTGALAVVSIAILLTSLTVSLYGDIRLARHELAAAELMLPLHRQIQLTQQHRGISAAVLSGTTAMRQKLGDKQAEVNAAMLVVDAVEARHSALLESKHEWQAIKSDWDSLRGGLMAMRVADTLVLHGRLIERLLRFQVAMADAGGLTLDSELDTYYLAEVMSRTLPDMLERLGKMRAKGTGILVTKTLTDDDRIEFSAHSLVLKSSFESLRVSLEKVGHHTPAIEPLLQGFSRELGKAGARAVGLLDTDIVSGRFALMPQDFFDEFTLAIDIGYRELFATLAPTLDRQLKQRIVRLNTYLILQVGVAAIFLLLLVYAYIGTYYSIIEAVRRLSAGAQTIASGDLAVRIGLDGHDELTSVGDSFNTMAGALDDLLRKSRETADVLAAALVEAKRADETKDAFLANVSHELRTPLNAVIGFADLARRAAASPEKQLDYLAKISSAGNTLSNVINDLLDLSKIAAGRMELDPVTFQLRQLITRSRSIMSFKLAEKRLQLIDRISENVPAILVGDNLRIEQILLNLLNNAVKFTHRGRIEIRIELQAQKEERVCLQISVEDSGIGMKEDEIARLFQPFSQADASMSRKYGGTGLGLALCRRLAQMMDGDISVTSVPGSGSTFHVTLWLGLGDAANLPKDASPASSEGLQVSYANARVLVVDDQPMNREIAEELLTCVGIEVRLAENGQQALDVLTEAGPEAFDLVLMDIQMPVMDGLTATSELRSRPDFNELPIIAMTAHTMEHEKNISRATGMNDHIGKPFETTKFFGVLARWIPLAKHVATRSPERLEEQADSNTTLGSGDELETLVGVDVSAGLARFSGKEDRYRSWLADFVANAGAIPGQIRSDIAAAHKDAAAQKAHAFKGRVGMLGMTELNRIASDVELAVRDGTNADGLLSVLDASIQAMHGELERVLGCGTKNKAINSPALKKVVWKDEFSVGVTELDEQHKKLIKLINQLAEFHQACVSAGNAETPAEYSGVLHEILSDVFDYTRVHFKAEEDYLQGIGNSEFAAHVSEHAAFVEKISAFTIASSSGVIEATKMHRYLVDWLVEHILESDRRYKRKLD